MKRRALLWSSLIDRLRELVRTPCSQCGQGDIRTRNRIRATFIDDQGRRYPDSWSYESCESCGLRLKRFSDGRIESPSDEEWAEFVG
jgi:hypothetical protein